MRTVVAGMLVMLATGCASPGAGGGSDVAPDRGSSGGAAGVAGTPAAGGSAGAAGVGSAGSGAAGAGVAGAGAAGTAGIGAAGAGAADAGAAGAGAAGAAGASVDAGKVDAILDTGAGTAAGTIVPLYTDPGDPSWAAIVAARVAHPTVRVVAIANPNSGPGAAKSSAFTAGIAKLVAAQIQVIGYIATGYASHSLASMEGAIDAWHTFYPQVGGIFFDEQSNLEADVAYYRTLSQYAKAHGLPYTVGNPGTDTAEAYIGALDTMLIYESKGLPSVAKLGGWHTKYAPENFGVIPYGAALDVTFVKNARKIVGYIYIQNDDLPNPWDTLPSFFGELLTALE
jgi:hypothetical protein